MTNNNQTNNNPFDTSAEDQGVAADAAAAAAAKGPGVKPVHKIRLGRLTASIWGREGKQGISRFSVTLGRSYKTDTGFHDTSRLDEVDLAFGARLLVMAQEWIVAQPAQ